MDSTATSILMEYFNCSQLAFSISDKFEGINSLYEFEVALASSPIPKDDLLINTLPGVTDKLSKNSISSPSLVVLLPHV